MSNLSSDTLLLAFVAIAAVALLLQAILLFLLFLAARKAFSSMNEKMEELRTAALPVLSGSRDLLTRVGPRVEAAIGKTERLIDRVSPHVESVAADVSGITHGLKEQTAHVQVAADEIIDRVRTQTGRVDAMVTGVLNQADRAGALIADAVKRPLRQMSGIVASLKAAVESLRSYEPPVHEREHAAPADKDLYI